MKRHLVSILVLCLLLSGCHPTASRASESKGYTLWFSTTQGGAGSPALGQESRTLEEGSQDAASLLRALFHGPTDPSLVSPFPAETALQEVTIQEGLVSVDLSEAYGGLSGVDLTLADACVVLTLCQLDGIERVYLTVEGEPRPFRDQILSPKDFVLDNR